MQSSHTVQTYTYIPMVCTACFRVTLETVVKVKGKAVRYTPWRRLGGEEV
jgi:hypothetical protein